MDSNTGFPDVTYLYMTRFVAWYFNFNCNSGANVYCVLRIVNFSTPFYILRYPGDNVVYTVSPQKTSHFNFRHNFAIC